jgi:hypothetical protein
VLSPLNSLRLPLDTVPRGFIRAEEFHFWMAFYRGLILEWPWDL